MRRWLSLLLVACLVAPVTAQNANAPPPSGAAPVVYAHGHANDGEVMWMNADPADPDATDTANGPGYTCGFTVTQIQDVACTVDAEAGAGITEPTVQDMDHIFRLPMEPGLAAGVTLIPGDIVFTVYLGANTGQGTGTFIARLLSEGQTVAESEATEFSFNSGYSASEARATPTVGVLPAGELVWEIDVDAQASGMFLGIHESTGKSQFVLPVETLAGTRLIFHDVNATVLETSFVWNRTDEAHQFNWTQAPGAVLLVVTGNVTGNATIAVVDAADVTLYNATWGGVAVRTPLNGTSGNWTLRVESYNATGNLTLSMSRLVIADGGDPELDGPDLVDGNETKLPGSQKDAPGAAAFAWLLALGAVATRRRR